MNSTLMVEAEVRTGDEIDLVEEMRLRTWARRNYAPVMEREEAWHPVILDEMTRMDGEPRLV